MGRFNDKCDDGQTYYDRECTPNEIYCLEHGFEGGYDAISDSCLEQAGVGGGSEALKDVIEKSTISPAEDYFNGKVLGLTKNREGDQVREIRLGSDHPKKFH